MEGRGVTNYNTDKPSYGFSTETTEFDEALLSRGIITFEQAMLAKGASPSEAIRLTRLHEQEQKGSSGDRDRFEKQNLVERDGNDSSDNQSNEDDDEEFMEKYRQMRLNELRSGKSKPGQKKFGDVIHIKRSDWTREVNDASKDGLWVVVNLTRSSSCLSQRHDELCDQVQDIMIELADRFEEVKFVSIPSNSAIENWPAKNLPTLFCYRYGKLQHQFIGIEAFGGLELNCDRVEWRLAMLGVLETDLQEDPASTPKSHSKKIHSAGAVTSLLATTDVDSDYNDVD